MLNFFLRSGVTSQRCSWQWGLVWVQGLSCKFLVLSLMLMIAGANTAWAQGLNKQKITASYLYNFAKNIEWPNQAAMTSFDIGVYGANNPSLMAELNVLRDKMKLRNLPIVVNQVNQVDALAKYHLV